MVKYSFDSIERLLRNCWMNTRPYRVASDFDAVYLAEAHQIYYVLDAHRPFFQEFELNYLHMVDLATMLVAYYEDFISETGIWKAFVVYNQEKFGYHLPFYTLKEDYDIDYINEEDLSFLIWHWLTITLRNELVFSPKSAEILSISSQVYQLLENDIEDMPATDAVLNFLTVKDRVQFPQIRHILDWVCRGNYLFGQLGFAERIGDIVADLMEDANHLPEGAARDRLEVDHRIAARYNTRCRLGGLLPCEWAARILQGPPKVREMVQGIQPRLTGAFRLLNKGQERYRLAHYPTGREVDLVRTSIDLKIKPGNWCFCSMVRWDGVFWGQGAGSSGFAEDLLAELGVDDSVPEQLLTPEEYRAWLDATRLYEQKFVEVLGSHVVVFPNPEAAFAAQLEVDRAVSHTRTTPHTLTEPPAGFDRHHKTRPLAIIFVPGHGIVYCQQTPLIISHLQDPGGSPYERNLVTSTLFNQVPPFAIDHILSTCPTEHLGWEGIAIDVVRDASFLTTYFQPDESGPLLPAVPYYADR